MRIIISKNLINASEKEAKAMDQLANLLAQVGVGVGKSKESLEDGESAWEDIVKHVHSGKATAAGGSLTIQDDNLVIDIADEAVIECMEAYSGLVNMLLPAALGFATTLKVAFKAYEGKLAAISNKYFK